MNATCPDGYVQEGTEECDDNNTNLNDECTDSCKSGFCGDGILLNDTLDADLKEDCDDGNNFTNDNCV